MAENKSTPQASNKYSIYAQRNVESTQVDWSKIASTLTKGAESIRDERQGRKDAIDVATQDSMEQLSKVEDVNNQDAASLLIDGSSMSTESLRVQSNMLKRGLIKPKDFKLFMQQQKNGYSNLNTAVKGWDKWATQATERLAIAKATSSPIASELEIELNKQLEGLGNLKNKKLWTNPVNGQMQLVTMGKNKDGIYNVMPDYNTEKEKFQNPNTMNNLMKFKLDRFDMKSATKRITDQTATIITAYEGNYNVLSGGGAIYSKESFRQLGKFGKDSNGKKLTFKDWKENEIDAVVGSSSETNNSNAGQVLAGRGYKYARTKKQFKSQYPNLDEKFFIPYETISGRPEITLTSAQQKEARNFVNNQIEAGIDDKLTISSAKAGQQKRQDTTNTTDINDAKNRRVAYAGDLNNLMSGDSGKASAVGEDRIVDMNKRFKESKSQSTKEIQKISRNADEFVIKQKEKGKDISVKIQRYEKDGKGGYDSSRPRPAKEIARELYRQILPADATDMSFDQFYQDAIDDGFSFTPRMIDNGSGTMVPNPDYKGDETTSTTENIRPIELYSSGSDYTDLNFTKTLADEYALIPKGRDNFEAATPVVMKSVERGLSAIPGARGITVTSNDVRFDSTNEIIVNFNNPVTGKPDKKVFKFNEDTTKLQGDVDVFINEQIQLYNDSIGSDIKGNASRFNK